MANRKRDRWTVLKSQIQRASAKLARIIRAVESGERELTDSEMKAFRSARIRFSKVIRRMEK